MATMAHALGQLLDRPLSAVNLQSRLMDLAGVTKVRSKLMNLAENCLYDRSNISGSGDLWFLAKFCFDLPGSVRGLLGVYRRRRRVLERQAAALVAGKPARCGGGDLQLRQRAGAVVAGLGVVVPHHAAGGTAHQEEAALSRRRR